jgi:5-methyltetrahydropteroyltriglutamate--homocysteine methyltransferase
MTLKTTTIGAYPKPGYVKLPDWFGLDGPDTSTPTRGWREAMDGMGDAAEELLSRAVAEVIADQVDAGIDIPTDGEVRRENYIHYHCRHLDGIDFENLTEKDVRGGNYRAELPTIRGAIRARAPFLPHDWRVAQATTDKPVKVTLPGPLTMGDTLSDAFYDDMRTRGADIADALNAEIRALSDAGCRHIQIDEPVFARRTREALDFGFDHVERAFHGIDASVTRTMHMCCGYPDRLDNPDYPKAPREAYFSLAAAVENSSIGAVSIEDAHRFNDLSLLEAFSGTTVIFGCVAVAKSRLETVEEIRERVAAALQHIDHDRLMLAPDCGLGLLGRDLARAKLANMCTAARMF